MAPISPKHSVSLPVRNFRQATHASRIPVSCKQKHVALDKPKPSVIEKSSGKVNIIKPIITKKAPVQTKNLKWTKSTEKPAVRRKSIEKAKDIRNKNVLKQATLPNRYFSKNVEVNESQTFSEEKENKTPNLIDISTSKESNINTFHATDNNNTSLRALQDQLNLEFVPNEFYRSQILNNRQLSPSLFQVISPAPKQPQDCSSIVDDLQRLTISSLPKRDGILKSNTMRSANKSIRKTPLSIKGPTPNSMKGCTWTPGLQSKTKEDPFETAMNSIRRLQEKKKSVPAAKPRACVALFQRAKNGLSEKTESPLASRRCTWASARQAGNGKLDPYETAMASIKKLKNKKPDFSSGTKLDSLLKSAEKSTPRSNLFHGEEPRRYTWAPGKGPIGKRVDPYEIAMAKIKELKMKTPNGKQNLELYTPSKTPVQIVRSFQKVEFSKSAKQLFSSSPLAVTSNDKLLALSLKEPSATKHSTPRHVSFTHLSRKTPSFVYRPIKEFLTQSMLKKQHRLTDISEHSENETTRSFESSGKESDICSGKPMEPRQSANPKEDVFSTPSAFILRNIDSNSLSFNRSGKLNTRIFTPPAASPLLSSSINPPSSKQRKLATPPPCHESLLFSVSSNAGLTKSPCHLFRNSSESKITTIKDFFPPISTTHDKNHNIPCNDSWSLLHTPQPISFYSPSPHRLTSEEFFERACCKLTPSHKVPICTPLVLKSMARNNEDDDLLSPVKQKLDFELMENDANENVVEHKVDGSRWEPRYSVYTNNILTKSKQEELLADDECASYNAKRSGLYSHCRNWLNPIAKILSVGDDMHFIPISPPI